MDSMRPRGIVYSDDGWRVDILVWYSYKLVRLVFGLSFVRTVYTVPGYSTGYPVNIIS